MDTDDVRLPIMLRTHHLETQRPRINGMEEKSGRVSKVVAQPTQSPGRRWQAGSGTRARDRYAKPYSSFGELLIGTMRRLRFTVVLIMSSGAKPQSALFSSLAAS